MKFRNLIAAIFLLTLIACNTDEPTYSTTAPVAEAINPNMVITCDTTIIEVDSCLVAEHPLFVAPAFKATLVNGRCNPKDCYIVQQANAQYNNIILRQILNEEGITEYDFNDRSNGCFTPQVPSAESVTYRETLGVRFLADTQEEAEEKMLRILNRLETEAKVTYDACHCM